MADRVQELMEAMVPELEDLTKRSLCSALEVKALIRKREQAEYALHKRAPMRDDFLRALQLEMNLEKLLHARRRRTGLPKRGAAEFAIRKRVNFIFDRALRRFKGDEQLWLQWIDYAQHTRAHARLTRIFARAVALLPRSAVLWIRAASFELEVRNNVSAARRLLQRALRANETDADLWHAYFRLELLFLHRVRSRREKLGLVVAVTDENADDASTDGDSDDSEGHEDEEDDYFKESLDGEGEDIVDILAHHQSLGAAGQGANSTANDRAISDSDDSHSDSEDSSEGSPEGSAVCKPASPLATAGSEAATSLGQLAIPWVVFLHMTKALPSDSAAQLRCLATCHDFNGTKPLRMQIASSMFSSFSGDGAVLRQVATQVCVSHMTASFLYPCALHWHAPLADICTLHEP
jgi:tetratricopeptide (TPR) repeat protein